MNVTIIDISGWIYRQFYGSAAMTRSDGTPTGAVNGCTRALWNTLRNNPGHICAVFDHGKRNWRHDLYPDYKAQRAAKTEEDRLRAESISRQTPLVHKMLDAFDVARISAENYEADDVIATLTRQALDQGIDVTIMSADKDLAQLVTENDDIPGVRMLEPLNRTLMGPHDVIKKYGVRPSQIADLLALWGDASDNILGVPKCGQVTAGKLLNAFGDIEGILAHAALDELMAPLTKVVRSNLVLFKDGLLRDRILTGLKDDAPVSLDMDAFRVTRPDSDKVSAFLDEMEFVTLRQDIFQQAA